jgi:hypothetical protein
LEYGPITAATVRQGGSQTQGVGSHFSRFTFPILPALRTQHSTSVSYTMPMVLITGTITTERITRPASKDQNTIYATRSHNHSGKAELS